MNFELYNKSLKTDQPPSSVNVFLQALWYDGRGDWHKAHSLVDGLEGKEAAWVHAYLHRKEGDLWNADYWYNRAGKTRPNFSLQEEWTALVKAFLTDA